jgi:hypothetical protein
MSAATADVLNQQVGGAEPIPVPTLTERMREQPLLSLGLAGLIGFLMGGGANSRTGAATLMLIARIWLRRAATDTLAAAVTSYGTAKRNGPR